MSIKEKILEFMERRNDSKYGEIDRFYVSKEDGNILLSCDLCLMLQRAFSYSLTFNEKENTIQLFLIEYFSSEEDNLLELIENIKEIFTEQKLIFTWDNEDEEWRTDEDECDMHTLLDYDEHKEEILKRLNELFNDEDIEDEDDDEDIEDEDEWECNCRFNCHGEMEENHMITHFDEYNLSCPKCGTLSKIVDAGSKDNVVTFIIECEKCNKLFLALGEKESEEWKFAEVERKK